MDFQLRWVRTNFYIRKENVNNLLWHKANNKDNLMPILWREEHKNVYWKFSNKNKRIIQKKPTKQHKLKTFLYVYISLLGPFASLYIYIHVLASAKEIQFENLLPSFFFCWSKRKFYTRLHFLLIIIIWLLWNERKKRPNKNFK